MRVQIYEYITSDSTVLDGQPCIDGTRVPVSAIIEQVAAGKTMADVARAFQLGPEAVRAALEFGAQRAAEPPPLEDPLLALAGILHELNLIVEEDRRLAEWEATSDRHASN